MGNKKNRNPEKKERKRIEKQQVTFPVQSNIGNGTKSVTQSEEAFNRGLEYYNQGEYDKAIKDYDTAIRLKPDFALAYSNRGNAYARKGMYDKAIRDYDEAIKLNPKYVNAYNNRGLAYYNEGEHTKAIKDYDTAIKLNPNSAEVYNNRGNAYNGNDEYTKAIKDYDEVIRLNPNFTNAYYSRGNAYFSKGDCTQAIKNYDEAIKLNPKHEDAYNNRGNAYAEKEDYTHAIKNYDEAIRFNPNAADSHSNKGIALVILGENNENRKLYKEWAKEANNHYVKWVEICIQQNIVDYTISMFIYRLHSLLLKEKDKISTNEIDEQTKKYINKIVKSEHDKNADEIKEYYKHNNENEKVQIRDSDGNIILYKYSSYDKNAIYNIKQRQMHFSDPSNFNDPFDPLIKVLDKEHSTGLIKLLNFRVSCLSPENDNLLLWSHYADKHKGICIAYDITKLVEQNNIIFRKIEHIEKFPKPEKGLMFTSLNTVNELNTRATLIDTFTKKQKVWDYEEEYRLIWHTEEKKEVLEVPIKAIYLGRDMPDKDKKFIKDMVDEMNLSRAKSKDIIVYSMDVSTEDIFQLKPI